MANTAVALPNPATIVALVEAMRSGSIVPEALDLGVAHVLDDPTVAPSAVISELAPRDQDDREIAQRIHACVADVANDLHARRLGPHTVALWAMGRVMPGLRGRVRAVDVRDKVVVALAKRAADKRPTAKGVDA